MTPQQREAVWRLVDRLLPKEEAKRLKNMNFVDEGFGYDVFGFEKESFALAYLFLRFFYKYWFRVRGYGYENVPRKGKVLIVPNHSGTIPVDFIMIAIDLFLHVNPPRVARGIVDHFAGALPYIGLIIYRTGSVIGARKNFEVLLQRHGETVVVFPEGTRGIGKGWANRYKLTRFNVGFIEMALKYRTPIVPTAVIGAEEQAPQIAKLTTVGKLLGLPYLPITPTFPLFGVLGLIPLPSRYYIYYGTPLHYYKAYKPSAIKDPVLVRQLADEVQGIVQDMINKGLKRRKSVFF